MFRARLLPFLIFAVYRALWLTWRIRVHEAPSTRRAFAANEAVVLAHWHGDELAILHLLKPYRASAMVSTSKDGELMDKVIRLLGSRTSRGSSTRGGAGALRGILRLAKEGWRPSVAVDGPKGPYHRVKPGVFEISKLLGARIVPVGAVTSRAHVFTRSWNKAFLPLPFARVQIIFDDPLPAIGREQDSHDPALAQRLEEALSNAQQNARNLIATP